MTWLSKIVRPKIRALVTRPEVPENLWHKCAGCGEMIFRKDYETNLHVCHHCGHHGRIPPLVRLPLVFDDGRFTRIELPKAPADPLRFRDRRKYTERLKEAQAATGEREAIVVAHGHAGGRPLVAAAFDFRFMGGSMGAGVGEALLTAAELARLQQAALLVIPASGGARMQEGILSLMQMARTTIATRMLKEAGLPYLVLLTDPTTGGVTASFAMLGDITLAEPGAVIGFAGRRVIEETIREKLPDDFQTAEYLLEHGMIDRIVPRRTLQNEIARLLQLLMPAARVA